jgi:hypothetical protein
MPTTLHRIARRLRSIADCIEHAGDVLHAALHMVERDDEPEPCSMCPDDDDLEVHGPHEACDVCGSAACFDDCSDVCRRCRQVHIDGNPCAVDDDDDCPVHSTDSGFCSFDCPDREVR